MRNIHEFEVKNLLRMANDAKERAYVLYSGFRVGACLKGASGAYYFGCNIENAAYTPSNCAERTAFFKAVSEGERRFRRIAIVAGPEGEKLIHTAPCGVCRQVMMEFCDPDAFRILLATGPDDYRTYTLRQLLPEGFGPDNL